MKFKPSLRGSAPSHAEEISRLAAELREQGKDIIALDIGQPRTGAPKEAIEAAVVAERSKHGYTPAAGLTELRQRIARYYQEKHDIDIPYQRIIVTIGASGAFNLTFTGCFDVGEKIAVPLPSYYAYLNTLSILGLKTVEFHPSPENNFQPTIADLEQLGDIDGLLITSPSNPTGSMIKEKEFREVIDYCQNNNIRLISDEIYHGIIYNTEISQNTALNYNDKLIVINSFSKYFSMPGWRLGWMVVPETMADPLQNLARNLYICPPAPSQYAALAVFDCTATLEGHVKYYAKNRDIFLSEMPKAGFDRFPPLDGAFYLYAHVKHLHQDSVEFCKIMLREVGIMAAPGTDFDPQHGHHYVRFSYAGVTEDIEKAVARLIKWRS